MPPRSERVAVEPLQIEGLAVPRLRIGTRFEPDALADLVADGLARPSEIAVHFAAHEVGRLAAAFDHERQRELGSPRLARVRCFGVGNRELEVHADVDDHAHRADRLRGQHAELVRGVLEIAELAHQALGVQRPPFAVAREEPERALEARQLLRQVLHLRDLQMMAGNAFVVTGAHFAPQRECRASEGGVPRTARPAEVFARTGVVHRRRAARGGDHRLALVERRGNVEVRPVELRDRAVDQVLVPGPELVLAFDRAAQVVVEVVGDGNHRLVGHHARRDRAHALLDPVELFPPPRVRLVEIELDPVEPTGEQRVAVASDRIAGVGFRRVVVFEEVCELRVRGRRGRGIPLELGVQLRVAVVTGDEGREERCGPGVFAAPSCRLLRATERLALRGEQSARHALA